ncbi:MAG: glycosyltransferase [Candidatus Methylomirabilales bacterium]
MKILLAAPGHLKTLPMGGYCAAALRRLGHTVVCFDSRPRWRDKLRRRHREDGPKPCRAPSANAGLRRIAAREQPDVFLALLGCDVDRDTVALLRAQGARTACWWLNDPFQLARSLHQAGWYDCYFTNSRGSLDAYRAAGTPGVRFLPVGIDPEVHRPRALDPAEAPRYASDICFAGDWSAVREQWLLRLQARFRVRLWGPWGKKLPLDSPLRAVLTDGFFRPDEMVKAFAGAKLVLNLHTWFGHWPYGVNPRLFEAAGTGACQLVDRKEEIPDLYRVPDEVVCVDSLEECERTAERLLAERSEREAIGARARERTLREHTYDARMQELLQAVCG